MTEVILGVIGAWKRGIKHTMGREMVSEGLWEEVIRDDGLKRCIHVRHLSRTTEKQKNSVLAERTTTEKSSTKGHGI